MGKTEKYTRSLKPEAIIHALKNAGYIHESAHHLTSIQQLYDEIQVSYTIIT